MSEVISKRRDRFSENAIDDETVLMQIDTGEFFSLQGTARTIWQLIDEVPDRHGLLDALEKRFDDVSRDTLAKDLAGFLHLLADAGFVNAR